jgi:hypothetical protein
MRRARAWVLGAAGVVLGIVHVGLGERGRAAAAVAIGGAGATVLAVRGRGGR